MLKLYFSLESGYYKLMDKLQKAGIPAYKWFVNPIEMQGYPSFPFAVLFSGLVVILLLVFLVLPVFFPAPTSLIVRVYANEAPANSGVVKLFSSTGFTAQAKVVNGSAVFENIPSNIDLQMRVESKGYEPFKKTIESGRERKVVAVLNSILNFQTTGAMKLEIVDPSGNPINGANVQCDGCSESPSLTSSDGVTWLKATALSNLHIVVSASGYTSNSFDFVLQPGDSERVTLFKEKKPPENLKFSVAVYLADETGKTIDGKVELRNYMDDSLISTGVTSSGYYIFKDVPKGATVYASATSDGYTSTNSKSDPKTLYADVTVHLTMKAESGGNRTTIRTFGEGDAALPGDVSLFGLPMANTTSTTVEKFGYLDHKATSGVVTFVLDPAWWYYVLATADGYYPQPSAPFAAGRDVNLTLIKMSNDTAAYVDAHVEGIIEGFKMPINGANVEMRNNFGALISVPATTNENGDARIGPVLKDQNVTVTASFPPYEDSIKLRLLGGDNNVSLLLTEPPVNITCKAVDTITGEEISKVNFTAKEFNETVSNCSGSGCSLDAYASAPVEIDALAPGYLAASDFIVPSANESNEIDLEMIRSDDVCCWSAECGYPVSGEQGPASGFNWPDESECNGYTTSGQCTTGNCLWRINKCMSCQNATCGDYASRSICTQNPCNLKIPCAWNSELGLHGACVPQQSEGSQAFPTNFCIRLFSPQLIDETGNSVSELVPGRKQFLKFRVASVGADSVGVKAIAGPLDSNENAEDEAAFFWNVFPSNYKDVIAVLASKNMTAVGSTCFGDSIPLGSVSRCGYPKKWVQTIFKGTDGVHTVMYEIYANPFASTVAQKVGIHFVAYAEKNGTVKRVPYDGYLEFNPSSDRLTTTLPNCAWVGPNPAAGSGGGGCRGRYCTK